MKIGEFMLKLDESVKNVMDGKDEHFDFTISFKGNSIILPMTADAYCSLDTLLRDHVRNDVSEELTSKMKWIADVQQHIGAGIIFFSHWDTIVLNPFMSPTMTEVDPYAYYGKKFTSSTWFNLTEPMIEKLTRTAIDFLNGSGIKTHKDTSFEDAVAYFLTAVCQDVSKMQIHNTIYSVKEIKRLGYYLPACSLLYKLTLSENRQRNYMKLWNSGITGYIKGIYDIS